MANQKEVAVVNAIIGLWRRGWSQRRIARELGIDRETVVRYIRAGSEADPKPAISTPGTAGRQSLCEPHLGQIEKALAEGLSAQRIYQDLVLESDFSGSYQSVKRCVRRLRKRNPKRFHRMECLPGEEAQVDFGNGPRIVDQEGRSRRTWIFRIVLSHSRKGYSEAVYRQDTESFIRCLENAFRYFGGVVQIVVIDNLRAAVKKADWFEPELNPKIESFCEHYGVLILPTRPYHPHHKGKVENAIGYVKDNAVKGREFSSLAELNEHLMWWEQQVADQRIHGTTRRQVGQHFEQAERQRLGPLPAMLFASFNEAKRKVHRDSHVEVAKAYYEVPPEHVGREVWVRWDSRTVRVFNLRLEQIAVYARLEPGRFSSETDSRGRARGAGRTSGYYEHQAALMGAGCGRWARAVAQQRGVASVRILQGLLALARRHPADLLDAACRRALSYGQLHIQDVRHHLDAPDAQQDFEFMHTHPVIRDMDAYGQFVEQHAHPQQGDDR
jgi:transposase